MSGSSERDVFLAEILGQPEALRRAGRAVVDQQASLGRLRAARADRATGPIVLTGMGSSLAACGAAATVLGGRGVLATAIDTAELLHFRLPALGPTTLLVVVSQSGESVEAVRLARGLRRRPDPPFIVAVANGSTSSLAALADLVLDTCVGPEAAPSTGTFAGALVLLDGLVRILSSPDESPVEGVGPAVAGDARGVATVVAALLADPGALADRMRSWLGDRHGLTVVGRGTGFAAAAMAALTIKEAAAFPADALETAAFRHGPIELAGPDLAVVILALEEPTAAFDRALADELAGAGTAVCLIDGVGGRPSPDSAGVGPTIESIDLPRLDRMMAPTAALIPLQLLAWQLALDRGRHPGEFVHATKVTVRE